MDDCIFCRIVAGSAPAYEVFEDGQVKAFMDAFPAAPGHVLVIPHRHFNNVFDIDTAAMRAVAEVARAGALAIRAALAPDGLTISQASGVAAGQSVAHYHVHLIPRTQGCKLRSHGIEAAGTSAALAAMADRIRAVWPNT